MNTRELDSMEFKYDSMQGGNLVKREGKWMLYGRVLAWCRFMGRFRKYGEWTVQETCVSASCRGTVRARIGGPRGTVEAWNAFEVFFIPKGVRPSKAPYPECLAEDAANGIAYWPELAFDADTYEGKARYGQYAVAAREHFAECVARACAKAGLQEGML